MRVATRFVETEMKPLIKGELKSFSAAVGLACKVPKFITEQQPLLFYYSSEAEFNDTSQKNLKAIK